LLFTEGTAGHNTLNTLSRFGVVFAYYYHDSRPHTFTLSLFQRWRDVYFSNPKITFQNLVQIRKPNPIKSKFSPLLDYYENPYLI